MDNLENNSNENTMLNLRFFSMVPSAIKIRWTKMFSIKRKEYVIEGDGDYSFGFILSNFSLFLSTAKFILACIYHQQVWKYLFYYNCSTLLLKIVTNLPFFVCDHLESIIYMWSLFKIFQSFLLQPEWNLSSQKALFGLALL